MSAQIDKEDLLEAKEPNSVWKKVSGVVLGIVTVCVILVVGVFTVVFVVMNRHSEQPIPGPSLCKPADQQACLFKLVESIPENLTYSAGSPLHPSTFTGIQEILKLAKDTIEIASFYWTIRPDDLPVQDPSDWQGEQLFQDLLFAGKERGIKLRIVQNYPGKGKTVPDTIYLAKNAGAEVRTLDFGRLLGSGIIHTKMWMVDRKHFYLGSANLDWRSFTQVKELGATVQECACLAGDLGKIFDAYWFLATPDSNIPSSWPPSYNTAYNSSSPMSINFNGTNYNTYLSSSPPAICPSGRDEDGNTIVRIITDADQFVHVAVMDYFPTTQFTHPRTYWPNIDDALRAAAFNNRVKVRLLFSHWNHTWNEMNIYLKSLQDLKYSDRSITIDIEVRLFVVPAFTQAQRNIPYGRVNHNKYMVTDKTAYIGTSNWSGDYFTTTAGIGLVVQGSNHGNSSDIRQQLADVFERDWNSQYSFPLSHFNQTSNQ